MDKTFVYMRFPLKALKDNYNEGLCLTFSEVAEFLSRVLCEDDEMFRILEVTKDKLEIIVFANPKEIQRFKYDTAVYLRNFYGKRSMESLGLINDVVVNIGSFQ